MVWSSETQTKNRRIIYTMKKSSIYLLCLLLFISNGCEKDCDWPYSKYENSTPTGNANVSFWLSPDYLNYWDNVDVYFDGQFKGNLDISEFLIEAPLICGGDHQINISITPGQHTFYRIYHNSSFSTSSTTATDSFNAESDHCYIVRN